VKFFHLAFCVALLFVFAVCAVISPPNLSALSKEAEAPANSSQLNEEAEAPANSSQLGGGGASQQQPKLNEEAEAPATRSNISK
jgi:hypothetical protein